MKSFLFTYCFFFWSLLAAQLQTAGPVKMKGGAAYTQTFNTVAHDTCLNKRFSIVCYIPNDSNFSRTPATAANFQASLVNGLNAAFSRICVSFAICSTVVMPHYTFNKWEYNATNAAATGGWYTDNTINLYIPDTFITWPALEQDGYAHAPGVWGGVDSPKPIIAFTNQKFTSNPDMRPVLHEFGHFFGLHDTYADLGPPATPPPSSPPFSVKIQSHEWVDQANCTVNGDGLCDTEADPFPAEFLPVPAPPGKSPHCNYDYQVGRKDGKGQFYRPPLDNYMSQYMCRCRFTQQQFNRMAWFILQYRIRLH